MILILNTLKSATFLALVTTLISTPALAGKPENCGNRQWNDDWQPHIDKYKNGAGARVLAAMAAQRLVSPSVDRERVANDWMLAGDAYRVCVNGSRKVARQVDIHAKIILAVPAEFSKSEKLEIFAIDYGFTEDLRQKTYTPRSQLKSIKITDVYLNSLSSKNAKQLTNVGQ